MKRRSLALIRILAMIMLLSLAVPVTASAATLRKTDNIWYYYNDDGEQDDTYTGLVKYKKSWFYVKDGVVDFTATTLVKYGKKWYYVSEGKVDFKYTGTFDYKGVEYTIENGIKTGKVSQQTKTTTVTRTKSAGGSGVMNSDAPDAKDFVINISTRKYHHPDCKSVGDILPKNRDDVHATVSDIEAEGYVRCKNCNSKYSY